MRYRLDFTPPSVLETYLGTRAVAKTFRASGAAGELARLGVHLHLLAFLDEERHANLEAGLERGEPWSRRRWRCRRARPARCAVTVSSTCGGNWSRSGCRCTSGSGRARCRRAATRSSPTVSALQRERLEALLIHEVVAVAVGVEEGRGDHVSRSGSLNFSPALKVLSNTARVSRLRIFSAHQRLAAARRRLRDFDVEAVIGRVLELEEHLPLDLDRFNQAGHVKSVSEPRRLVRPASRYARLKWLTTWVLARPLTFALRWPRDDLRRHRHRRRPQRPDRRGLPGARRTQGARPRAAPRARRRGGHRGGLPRLPVLRLLVRRVAAAARDHPRAGSAAPRAGDPAARRHVHADAERRLPVARERPREDAPRDRAALAARRRSVRRVRPRDGRDGTVRRSRSSACSRPIRRRSIRAG